MRSVITDGAPWVLDTDQFAVEAFASEVSAYHHTSAALAQLPPRALARKNKAVRANVARLRVINEMARDLGLTPSGRAKLGLTVARTTSAIQHIRPIRSDERAREVAQILAEARAIVPIDTEPVTEAEVVPLRAVGDGDNS